MKVKLTYFKSDTGKYYSDGTFECSDTLHMYEIFYLVRELATNRKLPGLVDGSYGWIILIDVPEHPHNHPQLVLPEEEHV